MKFGTGEFYEALLSHFSFHDLHALLSASQAEHATYLLQK